MHAFAPSAPLRRPTVWLVGVLLAAMLGAQWLTLRHTHAADGLAPECQVCEHAPAFAHAVAPSAPVVGTPAPSLLPRAPARVTAERPAPAPQARGPPAFVLH